MRMSILLPDRHYFFFARHGLVAGVLWLLLMVTGAGTARADDLRFALFGDTPYDATERAKLPLMLDAMARSGIAFAVHDGDIKNGGSRCSDDVYRDRLQVFQDVRFPLIYIPGDNEWTDCHRLFSGMYAPEERLQRLRELFFADNQTLGRVRFPLERQGDVDSQFRAYRENVRWRKGRVLFVGLNIPGGSNNWGGGSEPSAEFVSRGRANQKWLASSFELAHHHRDTVIFVIIQANPDLESLNARRQNLAYGDFVRQLYDLTLAFPGRVVLVHGDTHNQRIDQPFRDPRTRRPLRRFARVETFGSPHMGWTEVIIKDVESMPRVYFQVRPYK